MSRKTAQTTGFNGHALKTSSNKGTARSNSLLLGEWAQHSVHERPGWVVVVLCTGHAAGTWHVQVDSGSE
jgi:hypothetical protein